VARFHGGIPINLQRSAAFIALWIEMEILFYDAGIKRLEWKARPAGNATIENIFPVHKEF